MFKARYNLLVILEKGIEKVIALVLTDRCHIVGPKES